MTTAGAITLTQEKIRKENGGKLRTSFSSDSDFLELAVIVLPESNGRVGNDESRCELDSAQTAM